MKETFSCGVKFSPLKNKERLITVIREKDLLQVSETITHICKKIGVDQNLFWRFLHHQLRTRQVPNVNSFVLRSSFISSLKVFILTAPYTSVPSPCSCEM